MNLEDLKSGQLFGPYAIELTKVDADDYVWATGDEATPHKFGGNVHPLHLDAFVLSRLIADIGIVENRIETVHAGQQMTVHREVAPSENIVANATLKSCSNRRGSIWAIFETEFLDHSGAAVAESSSTIIMMP